MTRPLVFRRGAALAVLLAAALAPRLAAQAGGAPVVTLAEARRRAATTDPGVAAARGELNTAAWERRAATADLVTPNLSATTNYTAYNDPFFSFTGSPSTTTSTAQVQATYTLLGSGKFAELRRSRASLATAEANAEVAGYRAALAADAAYYGVLAEGELSRVAAERLRRAQEQLGIARVRVQAGETIATDSLQLVLEVNRARLGVVQRDSALAVARLRHALRRSTAGYATHT